MLNHKFQKKLDAFWEKLKVIKENEYLRAKKKIITLVDTKLKNKIRRVKGHKEVKYKKKPKSLAYFKKACLTTLQKYVRLRDTGLDGRWFCISCAIRLHRTKWNWWHCITRGNNATAFDLTNINLQCVKCNAFKGWNPIWYKEGYIKKYGRAKYDDLMIRKYRLVSLDKQRMIELTEKYNLINQTLESQKM